MIRMIISNSNSERIAYPEALQGLLNAANAEKSRDRLSGWPRLLKVATPLYELPDLAKEFRLGGCMSRMNVPN